MNRRHTDREYEGELESLRERVLLMGAHVEEVLALAMRAYVDRNVLLARGTIELDSTIDQLELEIDEAAIQILARRQPVASDLRFITTTLKLVTDLERIAPRPRTTPSLASPTLHKPWCTTRWTPSWRATR